MIRFMSDGAIARELRRRADDLDRRSSQSRERESRPGGAFGTYWSGSATDMGARDRERRRLSMQWFAWEFRAERCRAAAAALEEPDREQ